MEPRSAVVHAYVIRFRELAALSPWMSRLQERKSRDMSRNIRGIALSAQNVCNYQAHNKISEPLAHWHSKKYDFRQSSDLQRPGVRSITTRTQYFLGVAEDFANPWVQSLPSLSERHFGLYLICTAENTYLGGFDDDFCWKHWQALENTSTP
ncbi:hypothetical protein CISG_07562 [Coccidioides immitis RMSCC 3703]|uniref:Uncharacterized protein n=1 Tax=Coccidioides immitis RMSCC 3703 TaxID=454286 RepID=A0A0J8R223_COCIT|nr:hypothetical protein CISG_07562 [Coccidioides immitis RMSCC 3703]